MCVARPLKALGPAVEVYLYYIIILFLLLQCDNHSNYCGGSLVAAISRVLTIEWFERCNGIDLNTVLHVLVWTCFLRIPPFHVISIHLSVFLSVCYCRNILFIVTACYFISKLAAFFSQFCWINKKIKLLLLNLFK